MGDLTATLTSVVQYVLSFDATVMLPCVIFILALCFGIKPAKAFRSALMAGIGFVGVFTIFSLMGNAVGPAAQAMVERTGLNMPAVDLGWTPLSAITWGSPIAPFAIIMTLVINIVMLAFKWTKTLDIDIWNYWHFAFAGCLVYVATDNFLLLGAAVAAVVIIKIADWSAPMVAKHCGLPGISLPTLSSATFFPIGLLGNWILDKIPGINKLNADPETIQKKLGIFGEPLMIGFFLGLLLGLLAGYDIKDLLHLAIQLSAVMYILPRMTRILMDGLIPLSDGAKEFMHKRFPDRDDINIVLLAFIVPGNQTLPVADLANMAVFCSMIVVACDLNIVRAVIIGIPCLIADLLICSNVAPLITQLANNVGYDVSSSGGLVTAFLDGGNPFRFLLYQLSTGNVIAFVALAVVAVLLVFIYKVTKEHVYGADQAAE